MPRINRVDVGDNIYHIVNRANARVRIFDDLDDYKQFEDILREAVEKFEMRLLAYCFMPNHFHLVLHPREDGDLALFMGWVTNTHTRRWHTIKNTIGHGHLYQGRYKSFICQKDNHFLALVRYVERNAHRAHLVKRAEDWKWSSAWLRKNGKTEQKKILSSWPVSAPHDYLFFLNQPQNEEEVELIRKSILKNVPFGKEAWRDKVIEKFGLDQTIRNVGRPKKVLG